MMARGVLLRGFVFLILGLIMLPLLVVIGVSFNPTERFIITPLTPSLKWYSEFFSRSEYLHALFKVTLPLALVSSVFATGIGALTAIALTRLKLPGKALLEAVFMIPVLVPGILLGAALYLFFSRLDAVNSLLPLIIGHTLIGIPFVIRIVMAGLAGLNPSIEEAAINLGCNRVQAFCKVALPLIRSSLISGAVFAFILSFSDINVALFLSGTGTNTLPLHIFSEIQWQGDPTIAAASTIQIIVVTALIVLANRVFKARLVV